MSFGSCFCPRARSSVTGGESTRSQTQYARTKTKLGAPSWASATHWCMRASRIRSSKSDANTMVISGCMEKRLRPRAHLCWESRRFLSGCVARSTERCLLPPTHTWISKSGPIPLNPACLEAVEDVFGSPVPIGRRVSVLHHPCCMLHQPNSQVERDVVPLKGDIAFAFDLQADIVAPFEDGGVR